MKLGVKVSNFKSTSYVSVDARGGRTRSSASNFCPVSTARCIYRFSRSHVLGWF